LTGKEKSFTLSELRFYFDENVQVAVSEQLRRAGFDVVSAHDLGTLGEEDTKHLQRATEMGRVLCTYDDDFLALANQGFEHAGIVFAQHEKTSIGDWVREIRSLYAAITAEQAQGQVFYVRTKK
jgi:predicted nuclease of predicted toxin-antitoxin system